MTAGLVVDGLEQAGIATVVLGTLRTPLCGLPRAVVSGHALNRNLGEPGDVREHRRLVEDALDLLRIASEPSLLVERVAPSAMGV